MKLKLAIKKQGAKHLCCRDLNEFKTVVAETCCGLMDAAAQPLSLKTQKNTEAPRL